MMKSELLLKLKEAIFAVLPITLIVILVTLFIAPMSFYNMVIFITSVIVLIMGMCLFSLGADASMMAIGQTLGSAMVKSKKLWLIVISTFIIGIIITVAEPDLKVLAGQTPAIPSNILIYSIGLGIGIFLVIAFLRILFQWRLRTLLIISYVALIILALFVADDFIPLAFDSGGVTTGPITVPLVMALGVGLASIRGDKNAEEDSFGLTGLCSVGPILVVLILGLFFNISDSNYETIELANYTSLKEIGKVYADALPIYMEEIALAVAPILSFFIFYQIFLLKLSKKELIKIIVGLIYTYFGLVFFIMAANVGFMSVGFYLGSSLVKENLTWVLIPLGMIIGYFIVAAEPAVRVLKLQVEEMTNGTISARSMGLSLSIGVAISVGLAMIRVITGISIFYFLIPGYAFALIMSFYVKPVFTAIAFDSGGVASGPMSAAFLLPFAMGACDAIGNDIMRDAFGIVAMVAMTPLITVQAMGLIYTISNARRSKQLVMPLDLSDNDEIVDDSSAFMDEIIDNDVDEEVNNTNVDIDIDTNINEDINNIDTDSNLDIDGLNNHINEIISNNITADDNSAEISNNENNGITTSNSANDIQLDDDITNDIPNEEERE